MIKFIVSFFFRQLITNYQVHGHPILHFKPFKRLIKISFIEGELGTHMRGSVRRTLLIMGSGIILFYFVFVYLW